MRELIIKRIEELSTDTIFNAYRLKRKEFSKQWFYLGNDSWKSFDDDKLVLLFEKVCYYAYQQR